jgi:predicted dehydrogenase
MKKLKIGFIGVGGIATGAHLPAFAKLSDQVELAACASRRFEQAQQVAEQWGIGRVYETAEAMLAQEALDGVVIATPNKYHAPYATLALQAGAHVLCEKPPASWARSTPGGSRQSVAGGSPLPGTGRGPGRRLHQDRQPSAGAGALGPVESRAAANIEPMEEMNVRLQGTEGGVRLFPFEVYKEMHGTLVNITPAWLPEKPSPYEAQAEHFVAVMRGDAEPIVQMDQALKLQRIIDAIYRSAETGAAVRI